MPSTIPYDPALILGNIVPMNKLENSIKIAEAQAPADAAEAEMNSLISLKRSIDMTVQEMIDMGIETTNLVEESAQVGKQLEKAAVDFGKKKLAAVKAIQPLKAKMIGVNEAVESPIDYNRSQLKQMPISADSLQLNCQYFSFDENSQSSATHASTVAGFVSASVSYLGEKFSSEARNSAQLQLNSQHSRHSIAGTLVVSITCTHKNAQLFAPFILDVDKAVNSWNKLHPDNMIKTNSPASIAQIEAKSETKDDKAIQIISGATYGSSFVAMVHVLNTTESRSSQAMVSVAESLQTTFEVGGWFEEASGGFGVSSSFSDSAKNLLSTQNISSHCTMITMGIIPSIKSNEVKMAVQQFSEFDPAKSMENLAALQGATASEHTSIAESAQAAKTGQQMIALKDAQISSTLSGVADIDDGQNKIIDINSVMTALDDYIDRCVAGGNNIGVPINYYLKPITQSEIARAWLAKYYPNKFNKAGSVDDSKTSDNSDSGSTDSGGTDS